MRVDFRSLRSIALFLVVFLALFAHMPTNGLLPGNIDTLLAIALSNLIREFVSLAISGASTVTVFFPSESFVPYGENCFGLGLLYAIFWFFTRNDIWTYYLFISTLVAASAWGVSRLASLFAPTPKVAILAGLSYSLAGFTVANLDDANVVFVLFPAMSFYFLERGRREKSARLMALGTGLAGLQIWFGFYVFFFHSIAMAIYAVMNARDLRETLDPKSFARAVAAYFVIAAPLLGLYLWYHDSLKPWSIYSPYNDQIRAITSLDWHHFRNVLPDTLLHSDANNVYRDIDESVPSRLRKSCFPGFVFGSLALLGFVRSWRERRWLVVVSLVFFVLSFGTNLPYFDTFTSLSLGSYFRIPKRFLIVTLMLGSVAFAVELDSILARVRARAGRWAATGVFVVVAFFALAETTPYPIPGFDFSKELDAKRSYVTQFANTEGRRAVVLDLPTNLHRVLANGAKIDAYNRDILYMNWQTQHGQMIAGGVNAYQPETRVKVDRLAKHLPDHKFVRGLKEFGIEFLVFHKALVLAPEEDYLAELKKSEYLTLRYEDEDIAILAY